MTGALPAPSGTALVAQWSLQPVALAAVVLLTGWYLHAARRERGWPASRTVAFLAGMVLLVWTTCGFPQAYGRSLFSVWTAQTLGLLLAIPVVVMAGQPHELARSGFAHWRPVRVVANPLIGPAVVLVLSAVLFFGPVPGWAIRVPAFGWLLQLALVVIGAAITLPLVSLARSPGSLAVGLALMIGLVELVLDAVPGIVLRLSTRPVTTFFGHRMVHAWSPHALPDQRLAGAILWGVAEAIDLPFLVLVFRQWVRADREEAAQVDAVLDAEQAARAALDEPGARDAPWWLTDPALRDRFRE